MKFLPSAINNTASILFTEEIQGLLQLFKDDLPSPAETEAELSMWKQYLSQKSDIPRTALMTIKQCKKLIFPNIFKLLQILCTIPVTSCESERSFNALKKLKSCTRTTMAQDHLNGLALMHIHRGFSFNIEDIINRFARQHLRKMNLLILFSDLHSIDIHDCFNNYMHSLYNAYTYYTLFTHNICFILINKNISFCNPGV